MVILVTCTPGKTVVLTTKILVTYFKCYLLGLKPFVHFHSFQPVGFELHVVLPALGLDEQSNMNKPGYIFSSLADAPWRKPNCFTSLSVVFPESATYSQALLQGLKLGPFVLTNVTTCKLFLAQKSSLRDLIFGLVSPARARTRAGARAPPLPPHRPPGPAA